MKSIKFIKYFSLIFLCFTLINSSINSEKLKIRRGYSDSSGYMPLKGISHKLFAEADLGLYIPFQSYSTGINLNLKADYLIPLSRPYQFLAGLEMGLYLPGSTEGDIQIGGNTEKYEVDLTKFPIFVNVTYPLYFLDRYTRLGGQIYTFAGFGMGVQFLNNTSTVLNNETSEGDTSFTFHFFFGANYPLGPGYLRAVFDFDFAGVNTIVTGDRALSGFAIRIGYGMGFL
jgi:hypothetical protein